MPTYWGSRIEGYCLIREENRGYHGSKHADLVGLNGTARPRVRLPTRLQSGDIRHSVSASEVPRRWFEPDSSWGALCIAIEMRPAKSPS